MSLIYLLMFSVRLDPAVSKKTLSSWGIEISMDYRGLETPILRDFNHYFVKVGGRFGSRDIYVSDETKWVFVTIRDIHMVPKSFRAFLQEKSHTR